MRATGGVIVAAWVLASCYQPTSVTCTDGRVCPTGYVCEYGHGLCVLSEQLEQCRDMPDTTPCTLVDDGDGVCSKQVCLAAGCGDGLASGLEQCDRDDMRDITDCMQLGYYEMGPVSCRSDCSYNVTACTNICGDRTRDDQFGEECDDKDLGGLSDCTQIGFYDPGPLRCNGLCSYDRTACSGFCGDGMVNGNELCDGAPPSDGCIDFGYDTGAVTCAVGACAPNLADCTRLGWRLVQSPTTATLSSMWASSPTDVWALGSGTLVRYDGTAWTRPQTPSQAYFGIWGSAPNDIWMAGGSSKIAHYDGTTWTEVANSLAGHFNAIWGSAANDIWAVGSINGATGGVVHYDGATWQIAASTSGWPSMQSIWGFGPQDIWAVGFSGAIYRRSGTAWSRVASSPTTQNLFSVWGPSSDDVWAVGDAGTILHNDGGGWTAWPVTVTTRHLRAVRGTGPKDVWIAGDGGTLLHYDGVRWSEAAPPTPNNLAGLWPTAPDDVWTVGQSGTIARYAGASWKGQTVSTQRLFAVSTTGLLPTGAWAIGQGGTVLRYDGTRWTAVTDSPAQSTDTLEDVFVRSDDEAWLATGLGRVFRYDGLSWTTFSGLSPYKVLAIAGTATDVWAVATTDVLHHNGTGWSSETIAGVNLLSLWARTSDDVWVVGGSGKVLRRTATGWSDISAPTTAFLHSIWGSAPDDVWVCGSGGAILRYDGTSWVAVPSGTSAVLREIRGTGPDDVWAVGDSGTVVHWDGIRWTRVRSSALNQQLYGLAVTQRHTFIVGDGGFIDHLDRVSPWRGTCATSEASACNDAVDNDCDDAIDEQDTDCP